MKKAGRVNFILSVLNYEVLNLYSCMNASVSVYLLAFKLFTLVLYVGMQVTKTLILYEDY